jgi:CRP-like cAMP-binding protein
MLSDGRRAVTGFVFPDEFVDLSFHSRHTVSAEAVTELELGRISRRRFDGVLKASPSLWAHASKLISDRLRRLEDHVLVLARLNAEERLARFIIDVYGRSAIGEAIVLHMSRADVADYLGLTAETISRAAASLARRGLIVSRGQGHIVDVIKIEELKEIAQI